jgi:O-antigen ligase
VAFAGAAGNGPPHGRRAFPRRPVVRFLAARLEPVAIVAFLLIFSGLFWPPDGYLANPRVINGGASNVYDFASFVLLTLFLGIACLVRWRDMVPHLGSAWPVLALAALAFLSAFWSDDPSLVIRRSGSVTISTVFAIYLVARGDMADLIALLLKMLAIAMLASVAVIILAPAYAIGENETYVSAWRGAFTDKNTLGLACGLTIIIAGYCLTHRLSRRWLALSAIAMAVGLLYLSESKTPIVVVAVSLYAGIFALMLRRRSGLGVAASYLLGVIGLAGIGVFALDWTAIVEAMGRDATLTNRIPLWHYSMVYIQHRPWLGYGFGAFWRADGVEANVVWAMVGFKPPHAHNAWLEIGLGLGIVGIGLMALNWLVAFYRVARVAAAAGARHIGLCFALLIGIFIENMTEYEFFRPADILWVLFVIAIVHLGRARLMVRAARNTERDRASAGGVAAAAA